ncbi:MAG TPA: amino acid adenylation domain-containing protein, partial [Pyrinomonadaceae bacterium]
AVEQRQLLNRLHWMWGEYPFGAGEVMCQRTTASFSVSVWEMLGGLLQGCRTVIIGDAEAKDVGALVSEMERGEVTRVVVVPSLLRAMLEVEPGLCKRLSAVRMWSVCGEPLSGELAQSFQGQAGGAKLINQYGASELNDICFFETGGESGEHQAGSVPVGQPISNVSVYMLDARMRPVAMGQRGEMYVRSVSPARGYVGEAGATAERFVPDALSGEAGGRLYRTGDIGKRVKGKGGRIEHLGRGDDQVKVRGMRVELKGVEALLRSHASVAEAAVVARREGGEVTGLVGYVVRAAEDVEVSARELREFVRERGGEQMAPTLIVEVALMPLLANGKINRLALPDPQTVASEFEETFVSPRTAMEEELARIWTEVLGLERVGVNDRFFDLGGHSLIATRLITRVRDAFAVDLPLRSLFDAPTVAGQAIAIAQRKARKAEADDSISPLPQITPDLDRRHEPFPLTDIQQAYWIGRSHAFELGNVAAHSYMELESDGLDLERFNRALQQVIARHDMLRAVVSPDGQQRILEEVPAYQIQVLNLEGADSQTVEAELDALRRRMSHQVLPSDCWPLFEIRATRLSEQVYRLHLSFDLLFADAWSWQILGRELIQLYEQPETEFVPLDLSFRDYVLAEVEHQSSEVYRQSLAYWQERLPSLPAAPELPLTQNPASISQPRFARLQGRLEPDAWARLKATSSAAGLTSSGVLLAAFAEVLTAWSKSPRFTLNLTLFNRDAFHPQVNHIVGDFTSLNLLTVDNSQSESFEIRARRLQEQLWDDLDHRYASGVRLLRELTRLQGNGQRISMPVVFTSTLNLASSGRSGSGAGSQLGHVVYSISQTPQVWLDHQVHEQEGALVFNWDAVENLFPEGLLPDMFDAYCRLLQRLSVEEGSWRETAGHALPPAQLEQRVLVNATTSPVSTELLHELFARQITERSQQPAIITSARTLTYEELSRRSNQLGHRLREMGARPNRLVAIVMEKGWEQVVAALGILQAGAAYLPIDASLPKERLWYLLEHGEVELVVTQSWLDEMLEWPDGVRRIGVEDGDLEGASVEPLNTVQQPSDLAYVIYTSGSTGLPKGVMIDHRGAVNTVLDINTRFQVKPADRVFAISSLSFDLSVYDVFGMLAAGGAIVIPDAWAGRDPSHWAGLMREHGVTIWNSVPALMKILSEYAAGRGERLASSLRLVMLSGDWLPVNLPDQIKELSGAVEVVSLGGATEASIWSILYPIEAVDPKWPSIPYGRPMLNQQFHVLDEALEPRPVWVPGQLYIGGIGLAKGYWRDELKSNASFFTHPRTQEPLYRTGDLGRYLPDGNIEFLGREDFQVKIQGYRVELGEIEAALIEHPSVRAGVVAVAGEARGSKRLVAYIVPQHGDVPAASELRRFLKDKLPDYMVPAVYMTLDALPLTSNGKVDRKALPEMTKTTAGGQAVVQTELPESAARIGELLREFLKLEEIEPEMSLLDLGASSVDMIRIANLLEKELGFRPQIDEFYREPTLLGLANAYEQSSASDNAGDALAPPALPAEGAGIDSIIASFPVLKDPDARAEFKRRQANLRRDGQGGASVELPEIVSEKSLGIMLAARRTHRQFLRRPVALKQLAGLLNCLRAETLNGQPKYLYPSAGGIYPVQTYLHVKPGSVEGLEAGTYYYHPVEHRLISLAPGAEIPARAHDAFINRPVFVEAGFSIFLVGQLSAIAPIYGRHSAPFATLEAGYIGQLLMMSAPACRIGLCPVGIMDFESVRHLFALDGSHVLLHSLLGGAIDPEGDDSWSALQEDYQSGAVEAEREEIEL